MAKVNSKKNTLLRDIRFSRYALWIFALALFVRVIHILELRGAPFFGLLMGDAASYNDWARQIASGNWVGKEVFYQAPLYPYFLGVIYTIFNDSMLTVRICQAIVGALSCVLITYAGKNLFSKSAGVLAGLILTFYGPAIFFDGLIQKSVLDLFFVCLVLWILSKITAGPRSQLWWLLGVAMGALSLTRENALVFAIAILIWQLVQYRSTGKQCLISVVMFLLGLAVILFPVAARNKIIGGEFHLTTSQWGPNFYIGNNANANGMYTSLRGGRGIPKFERLDATELAEEAMGRSMSPAEVSRYWINEAVSYIKQYPVDWLKLKAKTLALALKATEVVDTEDQYTHAKWSKALWLTGHICHFGVIAPLALLGVCITWDRRKQLWVFYLMCAVYLASVTMFFVLGRFRYPLVPFLILFTSGGVCRIRSFVRSKPVLQTSICVLLVIAAAVFCNWPSISKESQQAITYSNMGIELSLQGKSDDAIKFYIESIKLNPDHCPTYYNLGKELALVGAFDSAAQCYMRALWCNPGDAAAYCYLGEMLTAQKKFEEAEKSFTESLRINPDYAQAHNQLGILYIIQNKLDKAVEHGLEAIRIDPNYANAYYNLGVAFSYQERIEDAVGCWKKTLELDPSYYKAHNNLASVFYKQNRIDEAIEQWKEAARINPKDTTAANNLQNVLAGREKGK